MQKVKGRQTGSSFKKADCLRNSFELSTPSLSGLQTRNATVANVYSPHQTNFRVTISTKNEFPELPHDLCQYSCTRTDRCFCPAGIRKCLPILECTHRKCPPSLGRDTQLNCFFGAQSGIQRSQSFGPDSPRHCTFWGTRNPPVPPQTRKISLAQNRLETPIA